MRVDVVEGGISRLPNFLVIGAPKSGTISLYSYPEGDYGR